MRAGVLAGRDTVVGRAGAAARHAFEPLLVVLDDAFPVSVVVAVHRPAGGERLEVEQQGFVDEVLAGGRAGTFVLEAGDHAGRRVVARRQGFLRAEPAAVGVQVLTVDALVADEVEVPALVAADGGGAGALAGEDVGGGEAGVAFFADDATVIVDPAGIADAEGQLRVGAGAGRRRGHLELELLRRAIPARHPELDVARIDDVVPEVEGVMPVRRAGDRAARDGGAIVAEETLFRHHAEPGGRRDRVRLAVATTARHEAPGPHARVRGGLGVVSRRDRPVAELRRDVGAGAEADVVEWGHLVDGRAAEVIPEVGGRDDGVVGPGGLIGAAGGEILRAQRLDLARFEPELAAGFDEAEGEGAVLVRAVA